MDAVVEHLGGLLYLVDSKEQALHKKSNHQGFILLQVLWTRVMNGQNAEKKVVPFNVGVTGKAFSTGQNIIIHAVQGCSFYDASVDSNGKLGNSMICTPVTLPTRIRHLLC